MSNDSVRQGEARYADRLLESRVLGSEKVPHPGSHPGSRTEIARSRLHALEGRLGFLCQ